MQPTRKSSTRVSDCRLFFFYPLSQLDSIVNFVLPRPYITSFSFCVLDLDFDTWRIVSLVDGKSTAPLSVQVNGVVTRTLLDGSPPINQAYTAILHFLGHTYFGELTGMDVTLIKAV